MGSRSLACPEWAPTMPFRWGQETGVRRMQCGHWRVADRQGSVDSSSSQCPCFENRVGPSRSASMIHHRLDFEPCRSRPALTLVAYEERIM